MHTVAHMSLVMVRSDFPPDLAYDIVSALFAHLPELQPSHGAFKA